MANERLRSTIAATGNTYESLASHVGVDPKTVERWVMRDRLPHRRRRWKTAEFLGQDEAYLWPEVLSDTRTQSASEAEFVHLYPTRGAVPAELWPSLIYRATDGLDFLAYAGLYLPDTNPELAGVLAERGAAGVRVRIALGDPDCSAVALRGAEQGIGDGMAERIRIALSYLAPAIGAPGVEVRLHQTTLYNSIFRADGTMLVNTHIYGSGAPANPVLHLQRVAGGRIHRQLEDVMVVAKVAALVMAGRTLGLVGFGGSAKATTRRARGFGLHVLATRQNMRQTDEADALGVTLVDLDTLLRESDFVSLHSPLNAETRHQIGARELRLMKKTAFLINTARGAIVNESALLDALRNHRIAGAGLDVFATEPLPRGHALADLPNVVITPHCAGITPEALEAGLGMAVENIWAFLAGKPAHVVTG
jgi:transcriptional regulator with XRE-family HTH domain